MSIAIRSRALADEVLLALEAYSNGGVDKEELAEDWSSGLLPRVYDTLNLFAMIPNAPAAVEVSRLAEDERGWLIECDGKWPYLGSVAPLSWLTVRGKLAGYGEQEFATTLDASQALRFSRREDAEAILRMYLGGHDRPETRAGFTITEHMWPIASQASTASELPSWNDVRAERQRQISAEGWTPEHDDEHKEGEMCFAAAGYACAASDALQAIEHQFDGDGQPTFNEPASLPNRAPWPHGWVFKRAPVRRQLVKAGALILAEIERIDRLLARGPICSDCGARKGKAHNYGCMYSELDV